MTKTFLLTEPDYLYGTDLSILTLIGDEYLPQVCNLLANYEKTITVYNANKDSELTWLMNCYNDCDICLLNCQLSGFLTGLFIDKPKTYYYNNILSYKMFNMNSGDDPVTILLNWITNEE